MRILVLSPKDHFHAPLVLRELCRSRPSDKISVLTTPKFFKSKSLASQISDLIQKSGFDYFQAMAAAQLRFRLNALKECLQKRILEEREFVSMCEIIAYFKLEHVQFKNVNSENSVQWIKGFQPDLILSNLFNQIVKKTVLEIPRYGCLNIHTSPLPKYRGMAPNFWALVNQEQEFGTTLHWMTEGIDDGDIAAQAKVPIYPEDSLFSFYRRCSLEAARLIPNLLEQLQLGESNCHYKQDSSGSSYYSYITPKAFKQFLSQGRRFY